MARIDKYDPYDGGFRAPLAAAWAGQANPIGVGLDVNGRVVPGAGQTGIVGVLCKPDAAAAGDQVDCMNDGDLVEFVGVAGTRYTASDATGVIDATAPGAGRTRIGFTVEATRLVVRVARGAA